MYFIALVHFDIRGKWNLDPLMMKFMAKGDTNQMYILKCNLLML